MARFAQKEGRKLVVQPEEDIGSLVAGTLEEFKNNPEKLAKALALPAGVAFGVALGKYKWMGKAAQALLSKSPQTFAKVIQQAATATKNVVQGLKPGKFLPPSNAGAIETIAGLPKKAHTILGIKTGLGVADQFAQRNINEARDKRQSKQQTLPLVGINGEEFVR